MCRLRLLRLLPLITLISVVNCFVLEGSDISYAKLSKWNSNQKNSSIILEFTSNQPDGLLLYTDDGGLDDFFELKLVEGSLRLRYNLGEGTQIMQVGRHLNDGLWHRVEIRLGVSECSLTVDGFVTQSRIVKGRDNIFGKIESNSLVFIGGLSSYFNNHLSELSLPSVVFEPRFRGAVRNINYMSLDGVVKPQEVLEWKGLVSGGGEACERHDPCQHGGFCISTDSGPVCDCKHIDFEGGFCEREKSPAEGTFRGGEWIGYDFRESGGEPIVSTLDEVSFLFKTGAVQHDGLLFYSGDGVDYLSLTLREGRITISINLGSGPLDARIHPDHLRFDDNQWHSVRVHRKVQEMSKTTSLCHITASVDGIHFDRWTLAGTFTILSSNRVTVGGFDMMRPLPGIKGVSNFIGCLKKVEYRGDTLRLSLLELARSGNRLVSVSGRLNYVCTENGEDVEHNEVSNKIASSENVLKTLSGGTVTFTTPESFLILPSWNASRSGSISLKIRTTEPGGVLLFARGKHLMGGRPSVFSLELLEGQLYVHLDLGSGPLRIQSTTDPIDDGEWHMIKLIRNGRSGTISVDDISTDFNTKGDSSLLELDSNLYLGNVPVDYELLNGIHQIWSLNLKKGFVGCVRGLVVNGGSVDLAAAAQQQDIGSVRPLCQVGSAGMCVSNPCLNGGKCGDGWGRYVCDCYHTGFEGAVCQRETPILTFDGSQYAIISEGSYLTEPVESHDIILRFKTNRPNGILISLMGLSSDFIELSLENAKLKLRVRLGDREKILQTGKELNDGHWHLIRISRRGNSLRMQLDDIPPLTGEILTRSWIFKLIKLQLSSMTNPFTGQLQHFVVNNLKILNNLKWNNFKANFNAKFKKGSEIVNNPTSFKSKHTYIGLPQLRGYSKSEIHFQFKTIELDGIILYNGNGNKNDFICVELLGGEIYYYFDKGGGVEFVKSVGVVNDNHWHDVSIFFDGVGQGGFLFLDGVDYRVGGSSGNSGNSGGFLDLNGVLYIGGVPENMYDGLPKIVKSRNGFLGCLASLDLGGEYLNPTTDALVPSNMVVSGCGDATRRCTSESCSNGGTCVEQWSGPGCDCEMTSYTGPTCAQESISYDFGPGRGAVLFSYQEERRPDTRADVIAFGFLTADPDAVLVRIDSGKTSDYLEIELMDGKVRSTYNMGNKEHSIGELSRRVNDRVYHVLRLTRSGSNATLQVDNWDSITRHPLLHHHLQMSSVFNSQAVIHVGGRFKQHKKVGVERPFQGVISGLVVNGLRLLDMATDKDPRVRIIGQTHQITSIGSIPSTNLKDDLHYMQKTTASLTPGINDDLVYSGDTRCSDSETDDDEDCISHHSGQGATDELITPVYIPRPRPTTTTQQYISTSSHRKKPLICDDEDCAEIGSGVSMVTETEEILTTNYYIPEISTKPEETEINWINPDFTTTDNYSPNIITETDSTTLKAITTTRFIPPHPPSLKPFIPVGRDFDFDPNPITIATPTVNNVNVVNIIPNDKKKLNETIYLAEAGDSTLIIIIIIAVLMIIIVSILIIFFMCKRRDDPIYKVSEEKRFEFPQGQGPGQGQGQLMPPGMRPAPGVGQGQGPRKTGVKEWYV